MAGLELAMYQFELEFVGLLQLCLMDASIPVMTASFLLPYFFIMPNLHTWGKACILSSSGPCTQCYFWFSVHLCLLSF